MCVTYRPPGARRRRAAGGRAAAPCLRTRAVWRAMGPATSGAVIKGWARRHDCARANVSWLTALQNVESDWAWKISGSAKRNIFTLVGCRPAGGE